ncbi:MAG TPA: hypothetical protein PLS74_12270, partial [Bacteroidales bacterium]|nr:hypothetical protein [Bacteroidales bacterium]
MFHGEGGSKKYFWRPGGTKTEGLAGFEPRSPDISGRRARDRREQSLRDHVEAASKAAFFVSW